MFVVALRDRVTTSNELVQVLWDLREVGVFVVVTGADLHTYKYTTVALRGHGACTLVCKTEAPSRASPVMRCVTWYDIQANSWGALAYYGYSVTVRRRRPRGLAR